MLVARRLAPLTVAPFLVVAACADGASTSPATSQPVVGKGDGVAARVSCVEEPARAGIATPLFRDVDDPHRYFAVPTRWVVDDASAIYWFTNGDLQYFDAREVAGYERYTFTTHLGLEPADDDATLLAALRAEDLEATLAPLPLATSAIDHIELATLGDTVIARHDTWDAAALAATLDLELSREGLEALTSFYGHRAGVLVAAAHLAFDCDDGLGIIRRDLYPQDSSASMRIAYDGIPVDSSAGRVAGESDQIMLWLHAILPLTYTRPLPEAEAANALRPLLAYDQTTSVSDVQAAGRAVSDLVEAWAAAVVADGRPQAEVDHDLESLRGHIDNLVAFAPEVRVHPVYDR